eukprot:COSAG05_NODE_2_length_63105_cov_159.292956_29_plen_204_part_00
MLSVPSGPTLPYPGTPAPAPELLRCFPELKKRILTQTGQTQQVYLDPSPQQIEEIVQALGPATCLCKIGVTVQDCVDTEGKPLDKLNLQRCTVWGNKDCMYNSMVYQRRPCGQKTDASILALTSNLEILNYVEDALVKGAKGSVNCNGGGGGRHKLEQFIDGWSTKLGIVYKMTPKAGSLEEYIDDCKVCPPLSPRLQSLLLI